MKKNFIKKNSLLILSSIFWIAILISFFYFKLSHNLSNEEIVKIYYNFLKKEGIFAGVFFVFIYTIRALIFFPTSLLLLLAPSLFGFPMALFYSILGENLTAIFGYYLGKFFGKNMFSEDLFDKFKFIKKNLKESQFLGVLTARLLFVPFDPFNFFCGIYRIKIKYFTIGTFFGTLSNLLIFLSIGNSIKNIEKFNLSSIDIDYRFLIFSAFVTLISIFIAYLIKNYSNKKAT